MTSPLPTILTEGSDSHACGTIFQTNNASEHDIINQMAVKLYGFGGATQISAQVKAANIGSMVLTSGTKYWRIITLIEKITNTQVRLTLSGIYGDSGLLSATTGLNVGDPVVTLGISPQVNGTIPAAGIDTTARTVLVNVPFYANLYTSSTANNYYVMRDWNPAHSLASYKTGIGFVVELPASVTGRSGNTLTLSSSASVDALNIGDQVLLSAGLTPINTLCTIIQKDSSARTVVIDSNVSVGGSSTGTITRAQVSRPANVLEQAGLNWVRIRETSSDPGRAAFAVGDSVRVLVRDTGFSPAAVNATITSIVENTIFLDQNLSVSDPALTSDSIIYVTSGLNSIVRLADFTELIEGVYLTLNGSTSIADKRISDMRSGFITIETGNPAAFSGFTWADVVRGCLVTDHNADHSFIERVRARDCNIGIHTIGDKANTMTLLHCDGSTNVREGILEESFLGNVWIMPHVSGNGSIQNVTSAMWFPGGTGGVPVGTASTRGVAGGTVELVNTAGFSSLLQVGTRIWTRDLRAVAESAGQQGEYDSAGDTPTRGAAIVWRSSGDVPAGQRIRYVDDGSQALHNWSPAGVPAGASTVGSYDAVLKRLFTTLSNGVTPTVPNASIVADTYIEVAGAGASPLTSSINPARVVSVNRTTSPYYVEVESGASLTGTVSPTALGTITLRSKSFAVGVGFAWIAPGFHIPESANSNRSFVHGVYSESNNYAATVNTVSAAVFASAGGAHALIVDGLPVTTSGGGRWYAQDDNVGEHQPGQSPSAGGSTGPTTFLGPSGNLCFGFRARHDNDQEYNLAYNTTAGTANAPYWYGFRHGAKNNDSSALVMALGGNHAIDASLIAGSANNRLWIVTGMYLGAKIVELSGTTRTNTLPYFCSLFRDVTGPRTATYLDDNNATGYQSHALAWAAAVPSGAIGDQKNNWNAGDLVFSTATASGTPAGWICSVTAPNTSSAPTFGEMWASLSGNLYLGSAAHQVTQIAVGNGSTNVAPVSATIRNTDATSSGTGGSMTLRAGDAASGAGGKLTLRAGDSTGNGGGDLLLRGGNGTDFPGGSLTMIGGSALGANQAGGTTTLSGGVATGNAASGAISIHRAAGIERTDAANADRAPPYFE